MKIRKKYHDNWMTPPDFYRALDKKYHFDFDPCPLNHDINEWDGLKVDWGSVNFVNPPYSRDLKESFVHKAAFECLKMKKRAIQLLPVSTSTKLFHHTILSNIKNGIEFIYKRLRFIGINDKGQYVNYDQIQTVTKEKIEYKDPEKGLIEIPKFVSQSGMHDSMIVIF